jgi:hypothetical protein
MGSDEADWVNEKIVSRQKQFARSSSKDHADVRVFHKLVLRCGTGTVGAERNHSGAHVFIADHGVS